MTQLTMNQLTIEQQKHEVSGRALLPILTVEKEKKSAPIVIQSRRTGKDYTFKISRSEFRNLWYTHIWIEKGGYKNFVHLGTWRSTKQTKGFIAKSHQRVTTKAAQAIAWVLRRVELEQWEKLSNQVLIMHSGHCLACGKELTDAESIARGLGPVCAKQGGL